jgi:hypothetical protein
MILTQNPNPSPEFQITPSGRPDLTTVWLVPSAAGHTHSTGLPPLPPPFFYVVSFPPIARVPVGAALMLGVTRDPEARAETAAALRAQLDVCAEERRRREGAERMENAKADEEVRVAGSGHRNSCRDLRFEKREKRGKKFGRNGRISTKHATLTITFPSPTNPCRWQRCSLRLPRRRPRARLRGQSL